MSLGGSTQYHTLDGERPDAGRGSWPGQAIQDRGGHVGYRRNLNPRCGVDRWAVGDRNHNYDPPLRFLYGGGDQGAGPILRPFFGARLPVIRPKITAPQDPADSGAPRSLLLEPGVEMFEAVLHFARPDRREFVVAQVLDPRGAAIARAQPLVFAV
jgi:hypothetical protein